MFVNCFVSVGFGVAELSVSVAGAWSARVSFSVGVSGVGSGPPPCEPSMTLSPPPRRPDPPLPHISVQEFFLDPSLDLVSVRASTMASRAVLLEASESNVEEETDPKSETETESKSGPEVCLVLGLGSSSGEGNPSMTVRGWCR